MSFAHTVELARPTCSFAGACRYERVAVLASLLTLRNAVKDIVRESWADILATVTSLATSHVDPERRAASGLSDKDSDRHLLDAIKLTIPLCKASEADIRALIAGATAESAADCAPDSKLGCIRGFVTCLCKLLHLTHLSRDCSMAAGAALVKMLSFAGDTREVLSSLSDGICPEGGPRQHDVPLPWMFTAVAGTGFACVYRGFPTFSKLSIVRGLMSTTPLESLSLAGTGSNASTCLHDSIFDVLTCLCDDCADHHVRFQALNALHTCLQQTVTRARNGSANNRILMASKQERVLRVIWNNLEDPSSGISGQVKALFEYLLDVRADTLADPETFWHQLTCRFLRLDWKRKGKYAPLVAITSRLSAQYLIELQPTLVHHLVQALSHTPVAPAAASLLEAVVCSLVRKGRVAESYLAIIVEPLLHALHSADAKMQTGTLDYALPMYLKCVPNGLGVLLESVRVGTGQRYLWALVAVLRVARAKQQVKELLFTGYDYGNDRADPSIRSASGHIAYAEMEMALTHEDGDLRLAALELLCVCYKTTLSLTAPEYSLLRIAVPQALTLTGTNLRSRCRALMGKLFVRLHQSSRQCMLRSQADQIPPTVERMKSFLQWMIQILVDSISPGCSYERKGNALQMWKEFCIVWLKPSDKVDKQSKNWHAGYDFNLPFVFTNTNTLAIIVATVDSYDKTRNLSCDILKMIPGHALPGFSTCAEVMQLVAWTKTLISSPRERESDAGALLLKLIFQRYVMKAGWKICVHGDTVTAEPHTIDQLEASAFFIGGLVKLLENQVKSSANNLQGSSHFSSIHGVLLTLRYCLDIADMSSTKFKPHDLKSFVVSMIGLLTEIMEMTMWALGDKTAYGPLFPADSAGRTGFSDVVQTTDGRSVLAPKEQMLVVGSWLSCKEMSAVVGTMATRIPFPRAEAKDGGVLAEPISSSQVKQMGELLLKVLLTTRHNGAIERTFLALQLVCKRSIRSPISSIATLCSGWLENLLSQVIVNDAYALRRSAGIPFAVLAVLYAEGGASQRPLLQRTMHTLLQTAGQPSNYAGRMQSAVKELDAGPQNARVHALNVLRVIINDTELSLDVMPYIAPSFISAICGTQSCHWNIMSASGPLFTALVSRALGRSRLNDSSTQTGVTASEFFSRFPTLHPFLLDTLRASENPEAVTAVGLHPGAYHVLLLLSKLLPSVSCTPESVDRLQAFIPNVRQCCAHNNHMGRCVAAAALAPLIADDDVRSYLEQVVATLVSGAGPNVLHGQASILRRLVCQRLTVGGFRDDDIGKAVQPVLALIKAPLCPMVRLQLLNAVAELSEAIITRQNTADRCTTQYLKELQTVARACMLEKSTAPATDLGQLQMRVKAADVWRATVSVLETPNTLSDDSAGADHVTTGLLALVHDSTRNIRVAGLKVAKRVLRDGLHNLVCTDTLAAALLDMAKHRQHDTILRHICSVLDLLRFDVSAGECQAFWQRTASGSPATELFYKIAQRAPHKISVVGPGVRFMGMLVGQVLNVWDADILDYSLAVQEAIVDRLEPWVSLVVDSADASQLSSIRGASVDSIANARAVLIVRRDSAHRYNAPWMSTVVRLWGVLIQLMQDENEDIRTAAAALSSSILYPHEERQSLACIVCKAAIEHLAHLLIKCPSAACLQFFCDTLSKDDQLLHQIQVNRERCQFNGKLFEKEEDNQYSEEGLLIQWASDAARRWCESVCSGEQGDQASHSSLTALRQVVALLFEVSQRVACVCEALEAAGSSRCIDSDSRVTVFCGATAHDGVFLGISRLALAMVAFAPVRQASCLKLNTEFADQMRAAVSALRALQCTPLLRCVVSRAIDAWGDI